MELKYHEHQLTSAEAWFLCYPRKSNAKIWVSMIIVELILKGIVKLKIEERFEGRSKVKGGTLFFLERGKNYLNYKPAPCEKPVVYSLHKRKRRWVQYFTKDIIREFPGLIQKGLSAKGYMDEDGWWFSAGPTSKGREFVRWLKSNLRYGELRFTAELKLGIPAAFQFIRRMGPYLMLLDNLDYQDLELVEGKLEESFFDPEITQSDFDRLFSRQSKTLSGSINFKQLTNLENYFNAILARTRVVRPAAENYDNEIDIYI